MSDYKKIPTSPEVWAVIKARHPELIAFSSYSAPDGDHLGGAPADNAEIRALIVDVITNRFNAAIDEAVKAVEAEYVGVSEQYEQDGFDLADKIKELKQ